MNEGKRYKEIDICRGILIVSVVFGHMEIWADYMYWFHMPAFFILAGMCYKYDRVSLMDTIKSVLGMYYIPYWSYFLLCGV